MMGVSGRDGGHMMLQKRTRVKKRRRESEGQIGKKKKEKKMNRKIKFKIKIKFEIKINIKREGERKQTCNENSFVIWNGKKGEVDCLFFPFKMVGKLFFRLPTTFPTFSYVPIRKSCRYHYNVIFLFFFHSNFSSTSRARRWLSLDEDKKKKNPQDFFFFSLLVLRIQFNFWVTQYSRTKTRPPTKSSPRSPAFSARALPPLAPSGRTGPLRILPSH